MNFIFDLDNTLFYNHIVDTQCALYSIPRSKNHSLNDIPSHVQNKCFELFANVEVMCNLQPFYNAVGMDKLLTDLGHDVYVVTARDDKLKDDTISMVKKHFPYVKDVVLVGSFDKHNTYKDLNADVVVDDHAKHIYDAYHADVNTLFMISNYNTPYNHKEIQKVRSAGGIIINGVEEILNYAHLWL